MSEINDLFCLNCEAILPIPELATCKTQCVVCKVEKLINVTGVHLVDVQEKTYAKKIKEKIEADKEELTQVEHICPKCDFNFASYTTQQTRSADEGQTVFYTCLQCKHRCIEYS